MKPMTLLVLLLVALSGPANASEPIEAPHAPAVGFEWHEAEGVGESDPDGDFEDYIQALALMKKARTNGVAMTADLDLAALRMKEASKNDVMLARIFVDVAMVGENDKYRSFLNWRKISESQEGGTPKGSAVSKADYEIILALSYAQETLLCLKAGTPLQPKLDDWISANDFMGHYVQATTWILSSFNESSSGDVSLSKANDMLSRIEAGSPRFEVARKFLARIEQKLADKVPGTGVNERVLCNQ